MLLIDYFKTCWLLNILPEWWRNVGDQKDTAPSRLFHCRPTLSCVDAVLASQFISSTLVQKCGQYYREVLLMQKLLLIIRVRDYFIFQQDSISACMLAQRRRSISLIYSSASNQTSSRRYCGPVQKVRPQPCRSQDMGRSSAAGELEWVSRFLTAHQHNYGRLYSAIHFDARWKIQK